MLDVDLVLYGRQLHCLRWEGTLPNLEEEGEEEGITGYHGYVVGERRVGKGCYGYVIHVCKLHEQLILHTRQHKGTYSAFYTNFQEGAPKSIRAI